MPPIISIITSIKEIIFRLEDSYENKRWSIKPLQRYLYPAKPHLHTLTNRKHYDRVELRVGMWAMDGNLLPTKSLRFSLRLKRESRSTIALRNEANLSHSIHESVPLDPIWASITRKEKSAEYIVNCLLGADLESSCFWFGIDGWRGLRWYAQEIKVLFNTWTPCTSLLLDLHLDCWSVFLGCCSPLSLDKCRSKLLHGGLGTGWSRARLCWLHKVLDMRDQSFFIFLNFFWLLRSI